MVELVSGPDSVLCTQPKSLSYIRSTTGYWNLRYRLCNYDFRRFPVPFGYLTQGNSIPELNWNECYHLKASGSICKRSTIPLHPFNSEGDIFFGSDELLTPHGTDVHTFPPEVLVPVGTGHYLVEYAANSRQNAIIFYWKSDERGAGFAGYYVYAPYVYRKNSQYRIQTRMTKGSMWTLPFPGYSYSTPWPEWYSDEVVVEHYPSKEEIDAAFIKSLEGAELNGIIQWINDGVDLDNYVIPEVKFENLITVSDLYGGLSPRRVRDYLNHYSHQFITDINSAVSEHIQEIEASAFDAIQKFDGNFYVFLSKLGILGSTTIQSFIDLYNSESLRQGLAGFWLANRFGDRLQLKSTVDLVNAVFDNILTANQPPKFIQGRARSNLQLDQLWNTSVACNCMLALNPKDYNGIMSAIRHAYEWDYFPSLANVWDAVPLSFVVNWFIDISSIFQDIDRMVQSRYYDVKCIMTSKKAEAICPVLPGVTLSYYAREFDHSLNLGVSGINFGLPSTINIVDGISLIASSF